jgi:hypothetical protein
VQKGLVSGDQWDEPPFEVLREVALGPGGRYTFALVETLDLRPLLGERSSDSVLYQVEVRSDPAVAFGRALELSAEDSRLEQRECRHGEPGSSCRDRLVAFVLKESNGHVTAVDRIADHLARGTVHSIELLHTKSAYLPGIGRKPEELVECEGASAHSALKVTSDIAVEAIVDVVPVWGRESVALVIQDALVLRITVSLDELGDYC